MEIRLDQLFLSGVAARKGKNPIFYTDSEGGLVFLTEVGATFDPPFVDRVLCRVYCDQGNLLIDTWPDPEKYGVSPQEMRQETLLENVDQVKWEFFSPPNPRIAINTQRVGQDEEEQDPPLDAWITSWKVGYRKIPPLLKLTFHQGRKMWSYATFLPATTYPLELAP